MSTLKADTITATSTNGDLNLSGNGTGNVNLATGTELNGTALTSTFLAPGGSGDGSGLTDLDASNLGSGTVPDARFPATLPAASGVNLTALNATNLGSGTVPDARFPATLPAASGVNLTALNATNLGSGSVPDARLPANLQSFPAPGSDGNLLTAASGAWTSAAAAGGGGGLEFIGTAVASNDAEIEFTSISSSFDSYRLICSEMTSTVDSYFKIIVGNDSGYITSGYDGCELKLGTAGTITNHAVGGTSLLDPNNLLVTASGVNSYISLNAIIYRSREKWGPVASCQYNGRLTSNTPQMGGLWGQYRDVAGYQFNKIKLKFSSGNIDTGRVTLFGVKNS